MVRTWSAGRSRTGLVIIPAWQNRQPRVHAAEHLDGQAIVHDLGERNELALRVGPVGQVGHRALDDLGRHVRVPRGDGDQPRHRRR